MPQRPRPQGRSSFHFPIAPLRDPLLSALLTRKPTPQPSRPPPSLIRSQSADAVLPGNQSLARATSKNWSTDWSKDPDVTTALARLVESLDGQGGSGAKAPPQRRTAPALALAGVAAAAAVGTVAWFAFIDGKSNPETVVASRAEPAKPLQEPVAAIKQAEVTADLLPLPPASVAPPAEAGAAEPVIPDAPKSELAAPEIAAANVPAPVIPEAAVPAAPEEPAGRAPSPVESTAPQADVGANAVTAGPAPSPKLLPTPAVPQPADAMVAAPEVPPVASGVYAARTLAACQALAGFGVRVTVSGNTLFWRHDLPLEPLGQAVSYRWDATIDKDGRITGGVSGSTNFSASGLYQDGLGKVDMFYPQCGGAPIPMIIMSTRIE